MKVRWVAAAGVIGLFGAFGAQGISQAATASPGVILAHGTASVRVSACRPQQLRLQNGPRASEKTQQETAIFVLRNVSSRPCELDGGTPAALADVVDVVFGEAGCMPRLTIWSAPVFPYAGRVVSAACSAAGARS
jgi:hypothetical protein